MKKLLTFVTLLSISFCNIFSIGGNTMNNDTKIAAFHDAGYKFDSFTTKSGKTVNLIFIKHGSIAIEIDGYLIYVDPVTIFGNDFSVLPKADMILITHEHHDHLDPKAVAVLSTDSTQIFSSSHVSQLFAEASPLTIGQKENINEVGFSFFTVPAYNITDGHLDFHPKNRGDLGFVFSVDGLNIYVAGDTENIPELTNLQGFIDIAFLPVNQPYTMTPEQAINAIETIRPKIVYPYHYGGTDLTSIVNSFSNSQTEVRVRDLQ